MGLCAVLYCRRLVVLREIMHDSKQALGIVSSKLGMIAPSFRYMVYRMRLTFFISSANSSSLFALSTA